MIIHEAFCLVQLEQIHYYLSTVACCDPFKVYQLQLIELGALCFLETVRFNKFETTRTNN